MNKKTLITYAVTFAVFCAGQFFLFLAGTPFCTAAAVVIAVSTTLTLLITKRYIPAAVFAAICLIPDLFAAAPGLHFLFYIAAFVAAGLTFGAVILANRIDLGLLLTDLAGISVGYIPMFLFIRYLMPLLSGSGTVDGLVSTAGLPLLSGFLVSAVVTFFAVPAVNVLTRDGF